MSLVLFTTGVILGILLAETRLSRAHERRLREHGAVMPSGDVYVALLVLYPSAFVLMEKFPLTSNGKIDRQAFPDFSREKLFAVPMPAKPQTDTQRELAAIWAELLNLESVGVDEDFFDLGGHSLLAIRAVARIRDRFEVNLSLRNLLESPTVAGLARVIDGLSWLTRSKAQEAGDREEIEL